MLTVEEEKKMLEEALFHRTEQLRQAVRRIEQLEMELSNLSTERKTSKKD